MTTSGPEIKRAVAFPREIGASPPVVRKPNRPAVALHVSASGPIGRSDITSPGRGECATDDRGTGDEQARWPEKRRIQPLDDLLRSTVRWMLRLPEEARPLELCKRYARIGNQLAANWGESDATFAYLYDLLHDRRGNRQGFPPEVRSELIVLYVHYVQLHPAAETNEEPAGAPGTPGVPYPFELSDPVPSATVTPLPSKAAAQAAAQATAQATAQAAVQATVHAARPAPVAATPIRKPEIG